MPDHKTGLAQARQRITQVRIAAQTAQMAEHPPDALAPVLTAALDAWRIERLTEDDPDTWLVIGDAGTPAGTDDYARRVHTLVQRMLDTGEFVRVEADVPVTAFARPADETGGEDPPTETVAEPQEGTVGAFSDAPDLPGTEDPQWALAAIRCPEAWALTPAAGGSGRGRGVVVGHPDTGYTLHPAIGREALDLNRDRDVISGDDDALDPLVPPHESPWLIPSPGHGTKTGSVIAGRATAARGVGGVAPEATLVPVRAVESVVQLFDSDVTRAVDHARRVGCRVISMSLGGKGLFGLEKAIQRAVDSGMIVMAAAGNQVGVVVAPASYANCVAVAATGIGDRPWPGSSRGRAVDVSAPGWSVHVASFDWDADPPHRTVRRSSGTSFAVAHLAGVAALWIAHHTRSASRRRTDRS